MKMKDKQRKYRELNELKGLLREKHITYTDLAEHLDLGLSAVSDKINGTSCFTIIEANKIIKLLDINAEAVNRYFFD